MAIKINLLPQSYALEKTRNRWIAGMAALLGLTALSIGLLYASDKKQLEKVQADVAAVKTVAAQTLAANQARDAAIASSSSIKTVVDFITDASKSGSERAALLDLLRHYIFGRAVISSLDLSSGTRATMGVTVRSPDEYARFLNALRQGATGLNAAGNATGVGKVFGSLPTASGVRGFPDYRPIPRADQLTETPTQIVFPIAITAEGVLRTDTNPRNGLMYVPVEPSGTVVSAVTAGAGGASGSGPSMATASASPSGSPSGSR